jgi:hypothetical protein
MKIDLVTIGGIHLFANFKKTFPIVDLEFLRNG